MTDAYEGATCHAEDLLFGRVGAEALFDRSEYEPSEPDLSSPSQIRGTPSGERSHLHRASRRQRDFDEVDLKRPDVIPDPRSFMESQMDRQDAMAETNGFESTIETSTFRCRASIQESLSNRKNQSSSICGMSAKQRTMPKLGYDRRIVIMTDDRNSTTHFLVCGLFYGDCGDHQGCATIINP